MDFNLQNPVKQWSGFKHSDTQSEAFTWLERKWPHTYITETSI